MVFRSLRRCRAGSNIVGSVLGRTSAPSVTPTMTASSAYTAGNVVGGLLTFTNAVDAALSGILQRVTVDCKSVQTAGFKLYVFAANPGSSTFTDKTAPAIAAADVGKLIDVICAGLTGQRAWNPYALRRRRFGGRPRAGRLEPHRGAGDDRHADLRLDLRHLGLARHPEGLIAP